MVAFGGFIILIATLYVVWNICSIFGVFEKSRGVSRVEQHIREEEKTATKRDRERDKLAFYAMLTNGVRKFVMSDLTYDQHKYIIERLEIRSKVLGRMYTPEELKGRYLMLFYIGVVFIPFIYISKLFWLVVIGFMSVYFLYMHYYRQKVDDEDEIIDTYFIDLFLLMYSRLRLGSKARLQSVLESYIDSLNASANVKVRDVMLRFSRFFLNNLSMYEDHEAVPRLTERYRSATVRNFCNIATQSLQGVNNADSLLSFKIELTRRKTDIMKKRAEELRIKGQRAIYLIYFILMMFIVAGWYSKMPKGLF